MLNCFLSTLEDAEFPAIGKTAFQHRQPKKSRIKVNMCASVWATVLKNNTLLHKHFYYYKCRLLFKGENTRGMTFVLGWGP